LSDPYGAAAPWYRRTLRWGQTNLTEVDPLRYDEAWWRRHWRRTRVQGVIVNAGGILAYYPSRFPLQRRAEHLGDRDLYGEIVGAARQEGLVVLARMDSNRADERFHGAHPDWFTVDADGVPHRSGDRYIACVNSPYYDEYLPGVLREIIERSAPDGFADNSWSGLERARICHCPHCARAFAAAAGERLPRTADWDDPGYRSWIRWNYARRVEIWDANNRVTTEAGGPDCLWLGMNAGEVISQGERFRDHRAIVKRAPLVMLDHQWRREGTGFHANGDAAKLIHSLFGWDRVIAESTAMYDAGRPTFRLGSKPPAEARMWAYDGIAAGLSPWWHHIGADSDDRRQYATAEPVFTWHAGHERFLTRRTPVASVAVLWSQDNHDFHGRDAPRERTGLPYSGVVDALVRARIPYLPLHADDVDGLDDDGSGVRVLVLPNLAAMTDEQCAQVRRFVARGGGLVATGETSRYDADGVARPDLALGDLLGVHVTDEHHGSTGPSEPSWERWAAHTYLRLQPSTRGRGDGPGATARSGDDARHPVLDGFDATDLLPFGGRLEVVRVRKGAEVLATFVPPFPIYPPETSWMRQPETAVPAVVVRDEAVTGGGRVAYLPADVDRCHGRDQHPDHARLLANAVRWAAGAPQPLTVTGPGLLDCHLYRQGGALVLHLVNLTGDGGRGPLHEVVPVGPVEVEVRLPGPAEAVVVRSLVAGGEQAHAVVGEVARFPVATVAEHEVLVVTPEGHSDDQGGAR
jgi:hypothetical protein